MKPVPPILKVALAILCSVACTTAALAVYPDKPIRLIVPYAPGDNGGARGACPGTRATWHQTTQWPAFMRRSNEAIMVWPLIESPQAIENIDAIASVPGIHALMLGPFDYAHAIGLPGQPQHPEVQAKYAAVMQAASRNRLEVVASLFSPTPEQMEEEKFNWIQAGARILVAGSDRRMLFNALAQRVKALRSTGA